MTRGERSTASAGAVLCLAGITATLVTVFNYVRRKLALRNAFRHAGARGGDEQLRILEQREADRRTASLQRARRSEKDFQWPGSVFHFCSKDDVRSVDYLLNKEDGSHAVALLRQEDMNGRTALHWAAASGAAKVCRAILAHPAIAAVDRSPRRPGSFSRKQMAAALGHTETSCGNPQPAETDTGGKLGGVGGEHRLGARRVILKRDDFGLSPLAHALICNHTAVLEVFRDFVEPAEFECCASYQIRRNASAMATSWMISRSADASEGALSSLDADKRTTLLEQQSEQPTDFWRRQPVLNTKSDLGQSSDGDHAPDVVGRKICHMTRQVFGPSPETVFPIPPELEWDLCGDGRTPDLAAHIDEVESLLKSDGCIEEDDSLAGGWGAAALSERHYGTEAGFLERILTRHWEPQGEAQVRWAGLRTKDSQKLVGFVAGIPFQYRIGTKEFEGLEVHSLFVAPEWRGNRLVPALVQQMVLHAIDSGIQFAVHTSVDRLPGNCPGSVVTYFQRPLAVERCLRLGGDALAKWTTLTDMLLAHEDDGVLDGIAELCRVLGSASHEVVVVPLDASLLDQAFALYNSYLEDFAVAPVVSREEFAHRFVHTPPLSYSFAVVRRRIGDAADAHMLACFSFYTLRESTNTSTDAEDSLNIAMSLFNARAKFEGTKFSMSQSQLLRLVAHTARRAGVDMFYCLNNADNAEGFADSLFQRCDNNDLYYYFYNVRLSRIIPPRALALSLP